MSRAATPVARIHIPAVPRGAPPGHAARPSEAAAAAVGMTPARVAGVRERAALLAGDGAWAAVIDDAGRWRSPTPGIAALLGDLFGPDYPSTTGYAPLGRAVAVACEVAEALGGVATPLAAPEDDGADEGRVY